MPFVSQAQVRMMFAKHPKIAEEWVKKYKQNLKKLPEKSKKSK